MSSIDDFIEEERNEINNLLSGLNQDQLQFLQSDITFINYLLSLLKSPAISKEQKNEIKKEVKKDIKDLKKETKKKQKENIGTYTLTSQIKPNTNEVDDATIDKAHMTQASSIVYDENGGFEKAQQYLDQMDIDYDIDTELSNSDGLVLHNSKTGDTKVAFRGTKFTNANDLYTDGLILTGLEQKDIIPETVKTFIGSPKNQFDDAVDLVNKATTKYGELPSESLGFSLGGAKAIAVADRTGIAKSTTFNPFLGKNNVSASPTNSIHNIWRTTEDIPSILVGFKNNHLNYKVNTIHPHKESLNPKEAHKLSNFLSNKKRSGGTLEELSKNVAEAGGKLGEAAQILSMKNYMRGQPQLRDADLLKHTDTSTDIKHPLIGHKTEDVTDFDFEELEPNFMESQLNLNYPSKEDLDFYENYSNVYDEYGEFGIAKDFKQSATDILNEQTPEPDIKNLEFRMDEISNSMADLEQRFYDITVQPEPSAGIKPVEVPLLVPEPENPIPFTDKTYTDWTHRFNSQSGVDTIINPDTNEPELISNRFHRNSRHAKVWKELGNDFTDKENEHFDTIEDEFGMGDDKFLLSEAERKSLYNASPEEENEILKDLSEDHLKKQIALEDHVSLDIEEPNPMLGEVGTQRSMTNDLIRSAHPINLGIGLLAGEGVEQTLNILDPDQKLNPYVRSAISGTSTGAIAGSAALYLGGNPITAAALAPEIVAGGLGALAGTKSYEALRKSGVDENSSTVASGVIGGATAGATSALISGAATGAAIGAGEAEFTFGTSVVVGAALGGLIGEGSYLRHKYF